MTISDITNQGHSGTTRNAIGMAMNMQQMAQQFMSLFMTEMTHQLPDKPLDQSQLLQAMSAQTSVATAVGQLQIAGENNALQADQLALSAQQFLGKQVLIATNKFYIDKKDKQIDLQYELPPGVSKAIITIKDKDGNTVYQGNAPDTSKGRKTFAWDHQIHDGKKKPKPLDSGDYTITIDLKNRDGSDVVDEQGNKLKAEVYAPQTIKEIDYNSGTGNGDASVMVMYGDDIRTPLGSIERVYQSASSAKSDFSGIKTQSHHFSWDPFGFQSAYRSMLHPEIQEDFLQEDNLNTNNSLKSDNSSLIKKPLIHRTDDNTQKTNTSMMKKLYALKYANNENLFSIYHKDLDNN